MADPGSSMHQRRAHQNAGAGYAPQPYYPAYVQYNGYQAQNLSPYQQQMAQQQQQMPLYQQQISPYQQQQQWHYYNTQNYYHRVPSSYPQHASYQPRQTANAHQHQNYTGPSRAAQEAAQRPSLPLPVPHTDAAALGSSPSPPITAEFSGHRAPYYPPVSFNLLTFELETDALQLPWLSVPSKPFPPRQQRSRRRPRPQSASQPVELPNRLSSNDVKKPESAKDHIVVHDVEANAAPQPLHISSPLQTEASAVSHVHSDKDTTSTVATPLTSQNQATPAIQSGVGSQKANVVVPVVPNLTTTAKPASEQTKPVPTQSTADVVNDSDQNAVRSDPSFTEVIDLPADLTKLAPKSWAELLRSRAGATGSPNIANPGQASASAQNRNTAQKRSKLLGNAISSFTIQEPNSEYKLAFLEPRGLINSGNMCYMNSVLQVLVFCVPFYNFLSHVGRNAVYSFKSDTPLLDALIMFMREFAVIDAAESLEKLRFRLKPNELEQFGEPLLPEYVYEEIRHMPRFATMQRGHQQDAEEFLGFLFEELHGECAKVIQNSGVQSVADPEVPVPAGNGDDDGWLEVGPRQKASTTRSSGSIDVDTPINRIFGGQLRSELRIPGNKNSVTLEPYQSLQLDIGSPEVRNITDALRGLTKPETLHGDFQSSRGSGATATKQVFIENLPPVLILHLKRFQYDNTGGTQKIWKKIGYPLDLEIPKEAFPHAKRGSFAVRGGLPKYRLISVIYHHGKSATAGHYTTDILRQDDRDWLRVDDTFIRRVRREDVEGNSEDDPKALAVALEQHRNDEAVSSVSVEGHAEDDSETMPSDKGWSQAKTGGKKWSGVVNGTNKSSGRATPVGPQSLKDNKVAYILFYERVER